MIEKTTINVTLNFKMINKYKQKFYKMANN